MGFEEATHIQEQSIPVALKGRDLIGQAQTGTGKTAAFGIPMIERCDPASPDVQGLVITPTRELAIQVAEEINRIGQLKGVFALPVYGGQNIAWQIKGLKNSPRIIVGTPGRLVDHIIYRKTIKVDRIGMAVLDEADEMLDMGFIEDIETILDRLPADRQTLLFSATMSATIKKLAGRFMRDPVSIGVTPRKMAVPSIAQHYAEVHEAQKFEVLCRLLDMQSPDLAIVFGRTKKRVDELQETLAKRGYSVGGLHGDLDQQRRESVMRQFRDGSVQVLVATDVAARGLDVTGVTHVYNFDIPQDPESYVHRIGRTGRAGKSGMSITFVTAREFRLLKFIEKVAGQRMVRIDVPTLDEAIKGQQLKVVDSLLRAADGDDGLKYRALAEMLLDDRDSVVIVSAALKLLIRERDSAPVQLTEVRPGRNGDRRAEKPRHDRVPGSHGKKNGYKDSPRARPGYGK
jgi:ATP-dependent RNA helicase DeaD